MNGLTKRQLLLVKAFAKMVSNEPVYTPYDDGRRFGANKILDFIKCLESGSDKYKDFTEHELTQNYLKSQEGGENEKPKKCSNQAE